jgi:hypothetical protein
MRTILHNSFLNRTKGHFGYNTTEQMYFTLFPCAHYSDTEKQMYTIVIISGQIDQSILYITKHYVLLI